MIIIGATSPDIMNSIDYSEILAKKVQIQPKKCQKWPESLLKSRKMTVFWLFWGQKCKYLAENDYSWCNFTRCNVLHQLFRNMGEKSSNLAPKTSKMDENGQNQPMQVTLRSSRGRKFCWGVYGTWYTHSPQLDEENIKKLKKSQVALRQLPGKYKFPSQCVIFSPPLTFPTFLETLIELKF